MREFILVLLWIGTWSVILPDDINNMTVVWICFALGVFGTLGYATWDAVKAEKKERTPPVIHPIRLHERRNRSRPSSM
jgi:heme/copper-type cytochrome/quinol oxidase subunit 2